MSKLVIRKKHLRAIDSCEEGIEAFKTFAAGKVLTITSKEQAKTFAVAFLDADSVQQRYDFLEWMFDEIMTPKINARVNKRTYKILYGSTPGKMPTNKKLRRSAKYLGKKLWQHRKRAKQYFKESL